MKLLEKFKAVTQFALIVSAFNLTAMTGVSAADTDIAQKMFDQAMEKRDTGDTFTAIQLFESLLQQQPQLNRARLELAVAYHQANLYQNAMREFKLVLDNPDTPENVRLSILAYMGQINSDLNRPEATHQFSYYLKAGLLNNSNLNASQAVSTGLNIAAGTELSSIGTDLAANVSHRYIKRDKLNIAGTIASFEWQSQATLSSNFYDKTDNFNLHTLSLSSGPAFISPGRWHGSINMRVDYIVLGSSLLATFTSINPTIAFDLGKFRSVFVETSFTTLGYDDPANAAYEGSQTMFGAGFTTYLQKNATGLETGFRITANNADDAVVAYDLTELYAGGFITLSDSSSVYVKYSNKQYDYQGFDTALNLVRNDSENNFAIGYNYDHLSGMLKGWTMNIEFSSIDSDSNANLFDYSRQIVTLNWARYFQ